MPSLPALPYTPKLPKGFLQAQGEGRSTGTMLPGLLEPSSFI